MKVFFTFILTSFSLAGFCQTTLSADTIAMLNKIMSRYADGNPGAQLAISRNGQTIFSSVRGMADLEHNVALTKTSNIEAGSVSKQFTAAAVLLLEKEGKLLLTDDVRKYIPELADYGSTITLRHLMQHVSGVKDWGSIADISGWPRTTKAYTNDDALEIIIRQKTLNNKPGDEYIYSNSGYTLLTHIVQRVSGMSHADFCKKHIFEPAGMKHTEWRDDFRKVVPERAIAYSKSGNNYIMVMPFENTYGHGGLLTTAEDLLAWNDYYLNGKLGGNDLFNKQITTTPLNNKKRNGYAAGLTTDSVRGWSAIAHSGATAAYRANLEYFPQHELSIALLSNNAQGEFGDIPSAVRNVFLKNLSAPNNSASTPAAAIALSNFAKYAGAYRENKVGGGLKVFLRDTVLMSEPNGRLIPLSANTASVGRERIIFNTVGLTLITAGGDTLAYAKADTAKAGERYLAQYAGLYSSEETESKMTLIIKDGKLFSSQRGANAPLIPVYKDGFSFAGGDLFFERNRQGKISKMFISISRARKVEFNRTALQ